MGKNCESIYRKLTTQKYFFECEMQEKFLHFHHKSDIRKRGERIKTKIIG